MQFLMQSPCPMRCVSKEACYSKSESGVNPQPWCSHDDKRHRYSKSESGVNPQPMHHYVGKNLVTTLSRACHHLSEKDGFFWMLRREIGKKRSVYWTYIDCFLAGFAAQHMGKAAFEQRMIRPSPQSLKNAPSRAGYVEVFFSVRFFLSSLLVFC